MGCKQFVIKSLKAILFLFGFVPFLISGQNYPRFELYQLKQGTDSGQFIVTGLDSNLAFNNILRFRSADSTFLIGTDTVITDQSIIPILLRTIDAGLGIDVNQVDNQIFIESLSIEDSIYNGTGTLIEKGTPLYAVGVQGNYWSVAPADASNPSKMPVVVIAGEDIADGGTGLGLIKGHIKQVNTTGLADGAEVYVASGGGYTATKPTAEGVIIQRLGTVIKGNSTNGSGIINLGDEAYWNDYTSLTKLRDTLVIFRDSVTNQIGDSLVLYVDRVELNDSLINYVDRVELGDSLALFLKTEVDGSVTNELQTLSKLGLDITLSNGGGTVRDSILTEAQVDSYVSNNGYLTSEVDGDITNELQTISKVGQNITLSDGGGTVRDSILTETQVDAYVANNGYLTAEVDGSVTNEIQNISTNGTAGNITISDGSTLTLNVNDADASATNEIQTLSYNATTDVISISGGNSIDITEVNQNQTITLSGDVTGSGTTAITATVVDDSHNHIIGNVDNLQNSLNAKQDNLSGTGIVKSTSGTISYITDNSSNWDAAFNDRIYTAAFTNLTGTNTKVLTLTQQDGGTVVASFVDETGGLWSEGSETNEIYYSGKIGVGLTNPDYPLHVSGRGYMTDDLLVYDRIYIGSDFNHLSGSHAPYIDRYSAVGETGMDFYAYNSGVNGPLFRFFDSYNAFQEVFTLNTASSTYQIIGDGDSDFNGDFNIDGRLDVNGIADFNSNQNSAHDFGVGSLNFYPFMWVDASADKMAVGGGTPQYTLDVTGDINFTGTLYDNGVAVTFGGGADTSYYTLNGSLDYGGNADGSLIYIPSSYVGCTLIESTFAFDTYSGTPYSGLIVGYVGSASGSTFTANTTLFTNSYSSETNIIFVSNSHTYTINSSNRLISINKTVSSGITSTVNFAFNIRCID